MRKEPERPSESTDALMRRELGERLKGMREQAKLTQNELAARLGIHRTSVMRYELGADIPAMLMVRWCVTVGGKMSELLEGLELEAK